MDKELIRQRFAAARLTYGEQARVQHLVVLRMMELLRSYLPKEPRCIYEFGCGTGDYSRLLLGLHPDRLVLNDLCPEMEESLTDILTSPCASFIPGDAEQLDILGRTDVITSCSTVQWFTSLPDFFQRCRQAITTGGILAFTTFGPHNMQEIRALAGNGLYYPEMEKLIGMLPAGFRLQAQRLSRVRSWRARWSPGRKPALRSPLRRACPVYFSQLPRNRLQAPRAKRPKAQAKYFSLLSFFD